MGEILKQLTEFQNRTISREDMTVLVIELLRQYRHDVMNDLQLIRGFYQLNRTDQMLASIQQAVDRAQKQTDLSNFPDPNVALVLLEADIMYPLLDLEIVPTAAEDDTGDTYPAETVSRLRSALQITGTFAMQKDQSLLLDLEFLQDQVIRILIYGKHEDSNWIKALQSAFLPYAGVVDFAVDEDHIALGIT